MLFRIMLRRLLKEPLSLEVCVSPYFSSSVLKSHFNLCTCKCTLRSTWSDADGVKVALCERLTDVLLLLLLFFFLKTEMDDSECMYELFSVIIHKGGCYGGHYHVYVRDVDELGNWQLQVSPKGFFSTLLDRSHFTHLSEAFGLFRQGEGLFFTVYNVYQDLVAN